MELKNGRCVMEKEVLEAKSLLEELEETEGIEGSVPRFPLSNKGRDRGSILDELFEFEKRALEKARELINREKFEAMEKYRQKLAFEKAKKNFSDLSREVLDNLLKRSSS